MTSFLKRIFGQGESKDVGIPLVEKPIRKKEEMQATLAEDTEVVDSIRDPLVFLIRNPEDVVELYQLMESKDMGVGERKYCFWRKISDVLPEVKLSQSQFTYKLAPKVLDGILIVESGKDVRSVSEWEAMRLVKKIV